MQRAIEAGRHLENVDQIILAFQNPERCYQWLLDHQLLWEKIVGGRICNKIGCPGWQMPMDFTVDRERSEGGRFRYRRDANHLCSLRENTLFEACKAPLVLIFRVIFHHILQKHSITRTINETELNKVTISKIFDLAIYSTHTEEAMCRVFDPICQTRILERENAEIWDRLDRGENLGNRRHFYHSPACEIDEGLVTHINEEQIWVVGAWNRHEKRAVVEVVGNEISAENLQRFVRSYVFTEYNLSTPLARTRVYNDGWRGYSFLQLPDSLYEGFTVIQEGNRFGIDINSTNRIEGFWSDLMREARFSGGRHFKDLRVVQMEVDLGNWRIKNRHNKVETLAQALLKLTERGGGIGTNICNLENFTAYISGNDLNDDFNDFVGQMMHVE